MKSLPVRTILFNLFLLIVYVNPLLSADKMTIAVMDIRPNGISNTAAKAASDVIRSEFVNVANFLIVERGAMNEILKEQGLQMSGCTDQSCAVKIGKLLSAQKIVVGEMNIINSTVLFTLRIIDVEKGVSEFSAREKAPSMEEMDIAAVKIARKLTQRIVSGNKEFFTPISPLGYYSRSIVPGWGQFYAGHELKGFTYAGLFVISGVVMYFNYQNYLDKRDAYKYEPIGSDQFAARRSDYQLASYLSWGSLGLMGAVYLAHWVDILFFSKPDFSSPEKVALKQNEEGLFFDVYSAAVRVPAARSSELLYQVTVGVRF